ncbi:hypothetical protein ACB092_06G276000 [Castanea dentata]
MTNDHARWNLTMHGLLLLDNHCESANHIFLLKVCRINLVFLSPLHVSNGRILDSQVPTIYRGVLTSSHLSKDLSQKHQLLCTSLDFRACYRLVVIACLFYLSSSKENFEASLFYLSSSKENY